MPAGAHKAAGNVETVSSFGGRCELDVGLRQVLEDEFGFGGLRLLQDTAVNGCRFVQFNTDGLGRICVSVTESSLNTWRKALSTSSGAESELRLPGAVATKLGERVAAWRDGSGVEKRVSVFKWCEGKSWKDVRPKTSRLFESLGRALGDICGSNLFETDAVGGKCSSDAGCVDPFLRTFASVGGDRFDTAAAEVLARFSALEASVPSYRSTVGFWSSRGFLVGEDTRAGVVGLSHVCDLFRCDVARAAALLAGEAALFTPDPLDAACAVMKGFHGACPLNDEELADMHALVGAGLGSRVVNSGRSCGEHEGDLAGLALEKWANVCPSFAHYAFRNACDLEPCPSRPLFDAWVRCNRTGLTSIFDFDLNENPRLVFDFGVDGIALKYMETLGDHDASIRHVAADMAIAGCRYGVGRYLETRLVYTSEAYMHKATDRQVARTVHLGVDLFVEAGTPVRSPVTGVLHSFQNNAADRDYGPTVVLQHDVSPELTFYSLYGHLSRDSLKGKHVGMEVAAGEVFGWVGTPGENGGWAPHVHFQLMLDMCGCRGDFVGAACPHLKRVYTSLCPDPNALLGIEGTDLGAECTSATDTFAKRQELLGNHQIMLFGVSPLRLVRGFLQYVYDNVGHHFLDMYNNVQHVGHQNPRVVRAGQQQMERLNVNSRYLNDVLTDCAQRLVATMPGDLRVCYFVNSGSEANELALQLARCYTGRQDMVVVEGGYHGNTSGCTALSSFKFDKPGAGGPEDWVHVLPLPDSYRGLYRGGATGQQYVDGATKILEGLEDRGVLPGGFICEGVLSCAGQIIPPVGYLQGVYSAVKRRGGVCIADEVQTGFGRMGTQFWAFQMHGVMPDIVTLGKPMGNGHPIGAVVTTKDIAERFSKKTTYFNTFGGNPVSAAVALEVIKVVQQENLQEHARDVGLMLGVGLSKLKDRHKIVGDVRGLGLFWGIEFVESSNRTPANECAHYVMQRLKDCGILVGVDGLRQNVVKIKPPLVVTECDIGIFLEALKNVLQEDFLQ